VLNFDLAGMYTILTLIVNINEIHAKMNAIAKLVVILAQCVYTKFAQRIFKHSDIQ